MPEAILLYRASCLRCRWLARLATTVAFGAMRRVPLDSGAARQLYERLPQTRGKLALIEADRVWIGVEVVPAGLGVAARGLIRAFRSCLAALATRRS
jgi:predicted DCC family thiol-disulfide oxidoreductase YuxK